MQVLESSAGFPPTTRMWQKENPAFAVTLGMVSALRSGVNTYTEDFSRFS
jgi:hypothetical protein